MIRVARPREPATFDVECRQRGLAWLAANPGDGRPRDYWSPFRPQLAQAFGNRCGYAAMYVPAGSVDHFLSAKNRRELAYEWRNYRFVDEWINKSKQTADAAVLDPFEVQDDWFEIQLPSLQLRITARVPARHRTRAEYTLTRLHLRDDERVIRQRRAWLEMYEQRELSLDGLARVAPLLAAAVRRAEPARKKPRKPRRKNA